MISLATRCEITLLAALRGSSLQAQHLCMARLGRPQQKDSLLALLTPVRQQDRRLRREQPTTPFSDLFMSQCFLTPAALLE